MIQSFGGWGQLLTSIGKPGSTSETKLMQATGILRQSPAWSSTSVQRLMELAQRVGMPTPDALRALQRAYNQARTARQRQEIATRMQETAKQLMPRLQEALQARLEHAEAIRRRKAIRRGTGD
jgi:pyrroline-5-carboxylate reductase